MMLSALKKVVNHKEINIIFTAFMIFVSIYIALVAILHRNFIDPMHYYRLNETSTQNIQNESSILRQKGVIRKNVDELTTIISLFFLWVVALIFGKISDYLYLPQLFGMLLAGILIRNVSLFSTFWQIGAEWDHILRRFAFILILIRLGANLKAETLRQSFGTFISFGLLSVTAEAAAIVIFSHFVLQIPVGNSMLFAYVLSATSPAVTIPAIIGLQEQGYDKDRHISTTILASVSIDNIYCITLFTIVGSVVFMGNQNIIHLIMRIPTEILAGILFGILIGFILRIFPRNNLNLVHFGRSISICSISTAVIFGADAIGCFMAGPITILILCVISSIRWKTDNIDATLKEENCYRTLWDFIFQPFFFSLIGLLLDFSEMTWSVFLTACAIIVIGVSIRFISMLAMSFFTQFNIKEKLFVSLCFFPKASVQAALAPLIFKYQSTDDNPKHVQLIFQTCVLSILITAPIGQLLIEVLGKVLLKKDENLEKIDMDAIPSIENQNQPQSNLHRSDKDNHLRLEVNTISNGNLQHENGFIPKSTDENTYI